jgi:hypothetical protein
MSSLLPRKVLLPCLKEPPASGRMLYGWAPTVNFSGIPLFAKLATKVGIWIAGSFNSEMITRRQKLLRCLTVSCLNKICLKIHDVWAAETLLCCWQAVEGYEIFTIGVTCSFSIMFILWVPFVYLCFLAEFELYMCYGSEIWVLYICPVMVILCLQNNICELWPQQSVKHNYLS